MSTDYQKNPQELGAMKPARRNLINFAFWSCLQLESDILAEVDLPPSGITRYEGMQYKEMPTGLTLELVPGLELTGQEDILRFYSYQVQLRRTMNDIHSVLYKKHTPKSNTKPVLGLIDVLEHNLEKWRGMLNDWDWAADDDQSSDINVARMRAKYYGAKYIIHRPAVNYCLRLVGAPQTPSIRHSDSLQPYPGSNFKSPPVQHEYSPAQSHDGVGNMGPPSTTQPMHIDKELLASVKQCIEAAIRSTTAFDSVPPRLIITNIFGTAHA